MEAARKLGCIAFLDFSKAYDRLYRYWLMQCIGALGLGPLAQQWVHLQHSQLTARVRFSGFSSAADWTHLCSCSPAYKRRRALSQPSSYLLRPLDAIGDLHCRAHGDRRGLGMPHSSTITCPPTTPDYPPGFRPQHAPALLPPRNRPKPCRHGCTYTTLPKSSFASTTTPVTSATSATTTLT